jgi:hypothetical protein
MHLEPEKIATEQAAAQLNRTVILNRSAIRRETTVRPCRQSTSSASDQLGNALHNPFTAQDVMPKMITDDQRRRWSLRRDQERAQKRDIGLESGYRWRYCPGFSRLVQDPSKLRRCMSPRSGLSFHEAVNRLDRTLATWNGPPLVGTLPNFGEEPLLLLAHEATFRNPPQPSGALQHPNLAPLNHDPTKSISVVFKHSTIV